MVSPNEEQRKQLDVKFHPDPGGDPQGVQRFRSRTDLRPPDLRVTRRTGDASDDPIFYGVKGGPGQDGPMVRDSRGRLLWYRRTRPPLSPYDVRAQVYQGKPVLTWWQGKVLSGKGRGLGMILDNSYRLVKRVRAGNGFDMDQHEFLLTPRGTAFINVYEPVIWNLGKVGGGKREVTWNSIVQEIDIKTGQVMFEWHSLAEVSVSLGVFPYREGFAYDPFHVNSVSEDGRGDLLLSARNINGLVFVNRGNGNVIWRMGGKRSDFRMGAGTHMIGQHHALFQPDGTISVADNGGSTRFPNKPDKPTRGIILRPNYEDRRVSLVREYRHEPKDLFSRSQASTQVLGNDNIFISWGGGNPFLTEFSRDGRIVFESHIVPKRDDTYRAFRMPWNAARGENKPDAAAFRTDGGTDVYVSWNGATEVDRWVVLAGEDEDLLVPVAESDWEGFETRIDLPEAVNPSFVRVRAVDADGNRLEATKTIRPKGS
jgi:Arylsulfotransferase (ASST)